MPLHGTKVSMRKITIILLVFFAFTASQQASGQYFYSGKEYGLSLGGSEYFGDLNTSYGFKYVRPAGGVFIRFHLNPYIALKTTLNYTKVGYDDKWSTDPYERKRNLNFKSDIGEFAVQAEFNFVKFATGDFNNRFTPYLTGGVGVFYYNPYTSYQGKRYYLRPLGTEGQNAGFDSHKYSPVSVCFPVGAGIKWWMRPGMNVGFEIADRLTLTDYIDDVSSYYVGSKYFAKDPQFKQPAAYYLQDRSLEVTPNDPLGRAGKQRGNTSTRDQYMMFMVNVSFQLKVYRCPGYMNHDASGD